MLISLTVGKVDAGVAVLLTEDKRLIEFPSILLPSTITSGSIVDITVSRNTASELQSQKAFSQLQSSILTAYGLASPSPPVLRCRNATQTSVVLEWDNIQLATADLRSLALYRNGARAGVIPKAGVESGDLRATKVSGLAVDTEYTFHLILRTSAGQYSSEKLAVRTHKMTDLSGITVTPGVLAPPLRQSLSGAVERIGAKMAETVRIDTTHFVCTEGRGREWEKALQSNIPVVRPEWIEGCEREGRLVGVRGYYLNADPKLRQVGQGIGVQPQSQQSPRMQQQPQTPQREGHTTAPVVEQRGPELREQPPTPSTAGTAPGEYERAEEEEGDEEPPRPPAKDTPAAEKESEDEGEEEDGAEDEEEGVDGKQDEEGEENEKGEGLGVERLREEKEMENEEPETPGTFSEVQL